MLQAEAHPIAAVVLNWNDVGRTLAAVSSLLALANPAMHVFLVDNGSSKADAAVLKQSFAREAVSVIALPENVGFARAVNAGAIAAMRSGAEFVLLFNNDARIDRGSTAIRDMLGALLADESLAAAGPIISNDDANRTMQSSTYSFSMWWPVPRANRKDSRTGRLRADSYLSGSCLLLRATAFATVGGLDPDYFLYGDDVDLARRLRAAGYDEYLVASRGIAHARAASTRVGSPNYIYTALRSNLIVVSKHARWYHLPSAAATCVAASLTLAALGLLKGNRRAPYAVFRAWRDFLGGRWGGYSGSRLAPARRPVSNDLRRSVATRR